MKYLKKFSKHSDYLNQLQEIQRPTVSVCKQENDVHYDTNYNSKQYFTSEALGNGTFTVTIGKNRSTDELHNISYSLDNGETWTTVDNVNSQAVTITTPSINAGDKVLWKGESLRLAGGKGVNMTTRFSSTCSSYNVSGNIMSLVYGDDFNTKENLSKKVPNACFCDFFMGQTALNSAKYLYLPPKVGQWGYRNMFQSCSQLKDIPELVISEVQAYGCCNMFYNNKSITKINISLNADILSECCYKEMFEGCTNLITSPKLHATTLAKDCYGRMFNGTSIIPDCSNIDFTSEDVVKSGGLQELFYGTNITDEDLFNILPINNNNKYYLPVTSLEEGCYKYMFGKCKSLTTAPVLSATTLAISCYENMFSGCTSLTIAPDLPATTLANSCYKEMLGTCTSLTSAPELPATTLANYCYQNMFYKCTSLTAAPELPATTLENGCYSSMFNGCTSLTTAPVLSATILADYCYQTMFYDCTSLTTAPELPATTLATYCYSRMFYNCSSLSVFPELRAKTLFPSCYYEMFNGCGDKKLIICLAENNISSGAAGLVPYSKYYKILVPESQLTYWNDRSSDYLKVFPYGETNCIATYNITTTTSNTTLVKNSSYYQDSPLDLIKSIEIDGNEQQSIFESYKFSTTGEHTVKYNLYTQSIPKEFFYYIYRLTSITFNDISYISKSAFQGCTSLTTLTIPNSVKVIEQYAFWGCPITILHIGSGVTNIASNSFSQENLESIIVDSNNTIYDSRNNCNAIIRKSDNALITGCQNTVIPANVTKFENNAFHNIELDSITISNNITYIGEYAINACNKYIFTSVQQLFNLCAGKILHSYDIGDEFEASTYAEIYINENKLTSITTPNNITSIDYNTFYFICNISDITSITLSDNVTSISNIELQDIPDLNTLNFGNGITTIPSNTLTWNYNITTIILGNSVTTIESNAFYYCRSLTTINIPNSVTYIGDGAFCGCDSLTDQTIRNKILSINPKAFDEPESEQEGD